MADTVASKAIAERREGSNPSFRTNGLDEICASGGMADTVASKATAERREGSSPSLHTNYEDYEKNCENGGTGRRNGLKIRRTEMFMWVRLPLLAPNMSYCFVGEIGKRAGVVTGVTKICSI